MCKKLLALGLSLLLMLSLVSCGETQETDDGRMQIVATLFPYYDIARAIAGDQANITLLVSAGRESHSYEPTPMDIIRIGEADLFLYNGGTDETWATEILATTDHGMAIPMLEQVEKHEEELVEGMQADRGHGHEHGEEPCDDPEHGHEADVHDEEICDDPTHDHDHTEEAAHEEDPAHGHDHGADEHAHEIEYDEHIWTSPVNAMTIARVTAEALIALDGENAAYYEKNLQDYLAELDALDEAFRETVAHAKRKLIVLGDRFPLLYFCREYGLDYRAAFLGCSTETEPSAATMAYLIDRVREEQIPCVYYLENSSGLVAEAISEAGGAEPCLIYSCQTVSPEDFRAGETYLSLMWRNAEALKKGLN